jgi:multiple sugar transport system substrate-binding protein
MIVKKVNRRDFLKMSSLAAASTALAACAPAATPTSAPQIEEKPSDTQAPKAEDTATAVPAPTDPPQAQAVTVQWWDFPRSWAGSGTAEDPNAWNKDLCTKYQELNPNVTMEFTSLSWADGPQKLDAALAADQGPDAQYGYPALFGKMLKLGVLQPIDDFLATQKQEDLDDFFEVSWQFVTVDGKRMGFPWYYGTEGEWGVNTTIVSEAKADDLVPKGPSYGWTPEEYLALLEKCTFKRDNGDQVWGTVIHCNEIEGINLYPYWSYPYMYGIRLYDEASRKSDFGSEPGVRSFQFMYDLVNKYQVAPPGAAGLTPDNMNELWNRKQSMVRVSNAIDIMNGIEQGIAAGTIEAPFEVIPVLPAVEQGKSPMVSGAVGPMMPFANQDANVSNEAIKFLSWLTNAENMEVFSTLSKLCARKSTTAKMSGDDPLTAWRIEYVLPNMAAYSKAPEDLQISTAWMQALQVMFDDKMTPAEAAQSFQDEANKLLQAG